MEEKDELFDDLDAVVEGTATVGEVTITPVEMPEAPPVDDTEVKPLEDLFPPEEKTEEKDTKKKDHKKKDKKTEEPKEEEEELYQGPRTVKAYGQILFVEENPKVTLDEIRERVVLEHGLKEFTKEETEMYFNKEVGIVIPRLKFNKKG